MEKACRGVGRWFLKDEFDNIFIRAVSLYTIQSLDWAIAMLVVAFADAALGRHSVSKVN
jgi:hypothetical protein